MGSNSHWDGFDAQALQENLTRLTQLSIQIAERIGEIAPKRMSIQAPDLEFLAKASPLKIADLFADPIRMMGQQASVWSQTIEHFATLQVAIARGTPPKPAEDDEDIGDARFDNPMWNENPYFNAIKRAYQTSASSALGFVNEVEGLDSATRERLRYFVGQIIEMAAPTNFLATNPEALTLAVETNGQSLVQGLENLLQDLEDSNGDFLVRLSQSNAFEPGKNIATTPGSVVFRNDIMEVIRYTPTTEKVFERPLIIFPPWINKYYVLDLSARKSLIAHALDQGHQVFVVSWVNPDESHCEVTLDTYVEEGFLTAIETVKKQLSVEQVNTVGYCIGGTTLALVLALLSQRDDPSIANATLLTTLTDFSDPGELGHFLADDFVDGIIDEVVEKGFLPSEVMTRTFSFLRPRDLIYGPAIQTYMMGRKPPAFDLLHWNGDGTNLPAAMTIQYLEDLCRENLFAGDGIEICGTKLHQTDIAQPVFAVACETDHIAGWRASYAGIASFGSRSKEFVLSQSGHVAGIVNPPSSGKYDHFTNATLDPTPEGWLANAERQKGTWWPYWFAWLDGRSGAKITARLDLPAKENDLGDAPGRYVHMKAAQAHGRRNTPAGGQSQTGV